MRKSEKKFDTSLRILEILKVLLNENIKKIDLIEKLKSNGNIGTVYTQEAFIKYFNTLQIMGFELEKVKNIYILQNALHQVDITQEEKNILTKIVEDYRNLSNKTVEKNLRSAISKINKYINPSIPFFELEEILLKEPKSNYDSVKENLILTIRNMIDDKQLVKLQYKRTKNLTEEITVELKEIAEKNQKFFVNCYCQSLARNKRISLEKIVSLVQLPRKTQEINYLNTVVFELYGRLANSYKLKPSESVINFEQGKIVVSNSEEDRDVLLRRLLKYGENCKIVTPKSMQEEMISLTNEMLKNLEEQ